MAVFAHGHVLRVLTARWLGLDPSEGRLFALETGAVSVLGYERETPVFLRWNQDSGGPAPRPTGARAPRGHRGRTGIPIGHTAGVTAIAPSLRLKKRTEGR